MMKPLYTMNGSRIGYRSDSKAGKYIGGKVYAHRAYAADVIDLGVYTMVKAELWAYDPQFCTNFNCICFDTRRGILRFDEAPDFDTAREPHPGRMVSISLKDFSITGSFSMQIWHHKWLWVRPDYEGFDVEESYLWSQKWLSCFTVPASGSPDKWKNQLKYYNLI